jgi:hypothetical protein
MGIMIHEGFMDTLRGHRYSFRASKKDFIDMPFSVRTVAGISSQTGIGPAGNGEGIPIFLADNEIVGGMC